MELEKLILKKSDKKSETNKNSERFDIIHNAIYGDGNISGLDIKSILDYCKMTNWKMVDKNGNCRLVDKEMLIDNATELINDALDDLKEKYHKFRLGLTDKSTLESIFSTGLFRVAAYIPDDYEDLENGLSEYVMVDIEFIANYSCSCGKIKNLF